MIPRVLVADHHVKYHPGERQIRVQRHPHGEEEPTMFSIVFFIWSILGFFALTLPDISALSGLFG
jgi:hypothetical protein